MAVQIILQDLTEKVNSGWKKQALAEHYGLPMSQMTNVLKEANLKIRKFHKPKYELISNVIDSETIIGDQPEIDLTVEDVRDIGDMENLPVQTISESEFIASLDAQSAVEETATTSSDESTW